MANYNPPGGRMMDTPDFSDSVPPTPPKQGDKGPNYYTDEHTFESGQAPTATASDESNWQGLIDDDALDGMSMDAGNVSNKWPGEGIRGFRPTPVGGTYNPGQGTAGLSSKSANSSASSEYSNAAYRG